MTSSNISRCETCGKPIGTDFKDLSYKGRHWHEDCFKCWSCQGTDTSYDTHSLIHSLLTHSFTPYSLFTHSLLTPHSRLTHSLLLTHASLTPYSLTSHSLTHASLTPYSLTHASLTHSLTSHSLTLRCCECVMVLLSLASLTPY